MPRVADLTVGIGVTTRQLQRGLNNARKNIRRFQRESVREFATFAKQGATAAAAFATAFGAAVVTQTRHVQELQRASTATRQSIQNIQAYGAALQALGKDQDSVNDLFIDFADRLRELQDNSSTYVEDFRILRLEARDFAGLNLDQSIRKFSQAVRESPDEIAAFASAARIVPEFQAIISQLGPTVDEMNSRLQATGGFLEDSTGELVELSKTFQIAGDTIRNNFIKGLQDSVGSTRQFDSVTASLGAAVRTATRAMVGAVQFVARFKDELLIAAGAVAAFIVAAKGLAVLKATLGVLSLALTPVALKIGALVAAAVALVAAAVAVGAAARIVQTQWAGLRAFFILLANSIQSRFAQLAVGVRLVMETAFQAVRGALAELGNQVIASLNRVITGINTVLAKALGIGLQVIRFRFDVAGGEAQIEVLRQRYQELGDTATQAFQGASNAVAGAVSGGFDQIKTDLKGLLPSFDFGAGGGAGGAGGARSPFTTLGDAVQQALKDAASAAGIRDAFRDLQGASTEALTALGRQIQRQQLQTQVQEALAGTSLATTRAFRDLLSGARSAPEVLARLTKAEVQRLMQAVAAQEQLNNLDLSPLQQFAKELRQQNLGESVRGFLENMRNSFRTAFETGDLSSLPKAFLANFQAAMAERASAQFASLAATLLDRLLGSLGSGSGAGGILRRLLPSFHNGGVVPGRRGQEVLALLQGGERVSREGAAGLVINLPLQVNGSMDAESRRAALLLREQSAASAYQLARENGAI